MQKISSQPLSNAQIYLRRLTDQSSKAKWRREALFKPDDLERKMPRPHFSLSVME
ncbi:predicted protein [Histoplasma mississippiense (nom. inval.)]|uniref:predicted protein n=1 Tax=Ajellomyces capsulatus (strain NAm1 / WU24) TaxID=2059318 RepID=UPI000157CC6C|nr:predicted protein [Histoplasma mississippiense (nom. inval.)]EDN10316.1 predicted protein [Histoplasma mississippiense (nom. inval.)]